ncbi:peptidoglycan pentaglycine glycine transferase (the second and third glycine) [Breznakia sp. PF5-3]|uniref:aminoacyltransferase n=1 Tax=unclassified Breznakia TaxID=2623764 RepID=UPI002406F901|nr:MULTISPECIES: aminoacyltransferase [unclassified Breznakia]MDF9824564.1 peptidoglycan pentaglycine glycine transferase (the second and third glycine) [Breznakia sp. PM6-1]MDF9835454.1 peptidoglycan pentaglycine glycine transferase (the second and third glycine) [Breznakia sp. PF5-3]MDF9837864.1 peptidoglycan pentaglycine glycine transferase (the second and third glycine) [Breznakia sp. PFB2-8]MDF9859843.1 peptidoglycan pentaglycine glycine transferase (the second and third glycine) [Breznaki
MRFSELSKTEYREFQLRHPYSNFLNSTESMDLEEAINLKVTYVGLKIDDKVVCATALVKMPAMKKFFYYYSPRGMLVNYEQMEQLSFFAKELEHYGKKQGAMYIVVDPYVLYQQRDIDGNPVAGGFYNQSVIDTLEKVGFQHTGFTRGYGKNMQYIRWMFALSLNGKTEEEIWKNLHQQTRWSINKTLKYSMQVREIAYDEMNIFYEIMKHTGERRHFANRDVTFYQKQYKAYGEHLKVLLAYLDVDKYLSSINIEYDKSLKDKEHVEQELEKTPNNKKFIKRKKVIDEAIQVAEKRRKEALELQEKHGSIIPMAASMFMFYGDEVTYLTSGSYDEFKGFYASYALQWEIIQRALKEGYKTYNFYGISGEFDETSPDFGVYKFKRGFDGQVEELIGDFIMVTKPILYKVYKTLKKGNI